MRGAHRIAGSDNSRGASHKSENPYEGPEMAAADMYQANILDHYKNPRNKGKLEPCTVHVEEDNPLCGDRVLLYVNLKNGTITDIAFDGQGCAISQASASMLTEHVKGKPLADATALDKDDILKLLGIPVSPVRMKCATLGLSSLKSAAAAFESKS